MSHLRSSQCVRDNDLELRFACVAGTVASDLNFVRMHHGRALSSVMEGLRQVVNSQRCRKAPVHVP